METRTESMTTAQRYLHSHLSIHLLVFITVIATVTPPAITATTTTNSNTKTNAKHSQNPRSTLQDMSPKHRHRSDTMDSSSDNNPPMQSDAANLRPTSDEKKQGNSVPNNTNGKQHDHVSKNSMQESNTQQKKSQLSNGNAIIDSDTDQRNTPFHHSSKLHIQENPEKTRISDEQQSFNETGLDLDLYFVEMTLTNEGHSVRVRWELTSTAVGRVGGFVVRYKMEGREDYDSSRLSKEVRAYILHSLHEDKQYSICVEAVGSGVKDKLSQVCRGWSKASRRLYMGVVAGAIFLLPCVGIVAWVLYQDALRHRMGRLREEYLDLQTNEQSPASTNGNSNDAETIGGENKTVSRDTIGGENKTVSRNSIGGENKTVSRDAIGGENKTVSRDATGGKNKTVSRDSIGGENKTVSRDAIGGENKTVSGDSQDERVDKVSSENVERSSKDKSNPGHDASGEENRAFQIDLSTTPPDGAKACGGP